MTDELLRKKFQDFLDTHNNNTAKTVWYRDIAKVTAIVALSVSIYQCNQKEIEITSLEIKSIALSSEVSALNSQLEAQKETNTQLEGIQKELANQIEESINQLSTALIANHKANKDYVDAKVSLSKKIRELKSKTDQFQGLKDRYQELDQSYDELNDEFKTASSTLLNLECDLKGYLDYFKGDGLAAEMIANVIKPSAIRVNRGLSSPRRPYIVVLSIHYPELLKSKIQDRIKSVNYIDVVDANGKKLELRKDKKLNTALGGPLDARFTADYQAYTLPNKFTVELEITSLEGTSSEFFTLTYPAEDGKFTTPRQCEKLKRL